MDMVFTSLRITKSMSDVITWVFAENVKWPALVIKAYFRRGGRGGRGDMVWVGIFLVCSGCFSSYDTTGR